MIELKSSILNNSIKEFYLNGLDNYDDFNLVINQLPKFGAKLKERIDGVYSRTAIIELNNLIFKIIYHDDYGTYSFLDGYQSTENNEKLAEILNKIVETLNGKVIK